MTNHASPQPLRRWRVSAAGESVSRLAALNFSRYIVQKSGAGVRDLPLSADECFVAFLAQAPANDALEASISNPGPCRVAEDTAEMRRDGSLICAGEPVSL